MGAAKERNRTSFLCSATIHNLKVEAHYDRLDQEEVGPEDNRKSDKTYIGEVKGIDISKAIVAIRFDRDRSNDLWTSYKKQKRLRHRLQTIKSSRKKESIKT